MKYSLIILAALLVGCGKNNTETFITEIPVAQEQVDDALNFQGVHYFKELSSGEVSGPITLSAAGPLVNSTQSSKLRSQNFNGSYGTHPLIRFSNQVPSGSKLYYSADITYSTSDDLEDDGTTSDLGSGRRFTIYEFEYLGNGKISLIIKIHENSLSGSGGINDLVIEREFESI